MNILYSARAKYNRHFDEDGSSWNKYIVWSRLTQLTELVSLDQSLNEVVIASDWNDEETYKYAVLSGVHHTGFFTLSDYVLKHTTTTSFNLIAGVINPEQDCKTLDLEGFDFIGYELIDQYYDTSALTNCGGFDETFLPGELNNFGLIDDFEKAIDIQKRLIENNPDEDHADTNIIGVWRHRTIGQL